MENESINFMTEYGHWIHTGAIIVSFIGVIISLIWHQKIAKKRATLDFLLDEEFDENLTAQRKKFLKLKESGSLSKWAAPENKTEPDAATLIAVLDRYEMVAVGINCSILDEKSYKKWCRTRLVHDWLDLKPYVEQVRRDTNHPLYYCEFEKLAKRWATKVESPHIV